MIKKKHFSQVQTGWQPTSRAASTRQNMLKFLHESEPPHPQAFENVTDAFSIYKIIRDDRGEAVDLEFVELNATAARNAGFSREQIIGQRYRNIFPQSSAAWVKRLADVVYTGQAIAQRHWEDIHSEMMFLKLRCFRAGPDLVAVIASDLTDEEQARQQLHDSEQRYRLIAAHLEDIVWQMDMNFNFVYVSPAIERVFGYSLDEAYQLSAANMFDAAGLSHVKDVMQNRLAGKGNIGIKPTEYKMKHKDGHGVEVEVLSSPIMDEDGKLAGLVGITRDITERKRVEAELVQANERLTLAQKSAGAGIWDWDMLTGQINWSPELFQLFSLDPNKTEASFDTWRSTIYPDDREMAETNINKTISDRMPLFNEYRIIHSSGEVRWINALGNTTYNEDGKAARMAGICIDITDRKRMEEALRQSEACLQESNQLMAAVLAHTHIQVVYLDPQFNFIWVNHAYAKTCQHEPAFFPGKNHFDLYPHEENKTIFQQVVDTGKPVFVAAKPFTFPDQPKRGVTYWDWSLIPVKGQKGKILGLVFTLAEVTDRIRAEKNLQKNHERLQAHVMKIESLQIQLREQAIRDPLTGLFNRRYLQETLDREISRSGRDAQPIGLIIMDIDHFKKINDAYGHQAGDKMLQALSDLLKANSRMEDIPCRYGGEEFVIVMPGAHIKTASERAEIIRARFDDMRVPFGEQELHATMSLGVAAYPIHGNTSDAVLIRADRALYRAKQGGRNRAVSYQGTATMSLPDE